MNPLTRFLPALHAIENNLASEEWEAASAAIDHLGHEVSVAHKEALAGPTGVLQFPGFVNNEQAQIHRDQDDVPTDPAA